MTIDLGDQTVTLNKTDRTRSAYFYIDDNGTVRVEFLREAVWKNAQGQIVHRNDTTTVERTQSDIAQKQYTAGGVTRTGNQILLLIDKMSDDERQIDINNGKL
jgi:hypothetical protein